MSSSSALQLSTILGPIVSAPNPTTTAIAVPTPQVILDRSNFMLWRSLTVPNFAGAGLHGHLDGTAAPPEKTITQGTGDAATSVTNPEYATWWTRDQRVLGLLLGSIGPDIAQQMIGKSTAASVWAAIHTMFGAQTRANVRHIRRQFQALRRTDSAGVYMDQVKVLADQMAAAGAKLSDEEIIDQMLTGLGPEFNPVAASMLRDTEEVSLTSFYSHVLSYEGLRAQQSQAPEEWVTSANAASRFGSYNNPSQPRSYYPPSNQGTGGRPPAPYTQQGQGSGSRPNSGGGGDRRQYDGSNRTGGNDSRNNDYNRNGGNGRNGNGRGKNRPRCQICYYWGHEARECRNRFNPEFQPRSANAASTSSSDVPPPWLMDSGATEHLTSQLERLQVHDRYDGKDQVQVANGAVLDRRESDLRFLADGETEEESDGSLLLRRLHPEEEEEKEEEEEEDDTSSDEPPAKRLSPTGNLGDRRPTAGTREDEDNEGPPAAAETTTSPPVAARDEGSDGP
ncbi:hypothetical protein QYE76_033780 [Lolium multiflorum]|uniref:Uncharacterized protein n=1 Tax=Lolium multiflorum TaxID=4521 RepID=A0AAD8QY14_LOLMU|nr:hypothetical protein QYE76_033780 [Lolium multiflorum]